MVITRGLIGETLQISLWMVSLLNVSGEYRHTCTGRVDASVWTSGEDINLDVREMSLDCFGYLNGNRTMLWHTPP